MKEPLPLARVHEAVLTFLQHRDDAALFGAQAVNAYVDEPRMTQDVDILATDARGLAEALRSYLAEKFHIATRTREVAGGLGFRVYQVRQPKNRHLAVVRQVDALPPTELIADIRVPTVPELIAQKVISAQMRPNQPKGDTDRRDLKLLLLAYPSLKREAGPVMERLEAANAPASVIAAWRQWVASEIGAADDAAEFGG